MDLNRTLYTFLGILFQVVCLQSSAPKIYTNTYAVHIDGGPAEADRVARDTGFINLGMIIQDHYHFLDRHSKVKRSLDQNEMRHLPLKREPNVRWIEQQVVKRRVKRDNVINMWDPHFSDPKWPLWYLQRQSGPDLDMNVLPAWRKGYTGKGVVVSILDDGIEKNHPDLQANYDAEGSTDVNGNDNDPTPRYDFSNENRHGTRCAGEVAASANNSICSVGVAWEAGIGGVRMLDGEVTDAVEARSLSHNPQHVDIYSASWGPDDDGKTVDGPGKLAKVSFSDGVKMGRGGLGSIFVWASGNGGRSQDSCNCDGYTNSIYTISVSSVSERGDIPWYSEACASTIATTYSSGGGSEQQIITTDLHQGCTTRHSGTSASAPLAAGICALALQANPRLNWRDLQHIIVQTSKKKHLRANDWKKNGAGLEVSHSYGFGLMDAAAMVDKAEKWHTVPEQHICNAKATGLPLTIPANGKLLIKFNTSGCVGQSNYVRYLEHVHARITITHSRRGDLSIHVTSPMGTRSNLLPERPRDYSREGFDHWDFMTTHSWGEDPSGTWLLEIKNAKNTQNTGRITEWELVLYGTDTHPLESSFGPKNCNEGFYLHTNVTQEKTKIKSCQKCHYTCKSCFGPEASDCAECSFDYTKRDLYCVLVEVNVVQIDNMFLFAWVFLLCILAVVLFLIVFFTLQAKDNGFCCWSESVFYQALNGEKTRDYEYHELTKNGELSDEEDVLFKEGNGKMTTPGL